MSSAQGITASTITNKYYYQQDALGTVYGLVDESGSVPWFSYGHVPWGDWSVGTGAVSSNRLRWKGLFYEGGNSQLSYVRARWYDPRTHRFLSEDALGVLAGINPYTFGENDPVNSGDPSGRAVSDSRGACSILASCGHSDWSDLPFANESSGGRPLTDEERKNLGEICTKTDVCDKIRIHEEPSFLMMGALTLGYDIYIPSNLISSTYILAHEAYHVVQYDTWGSDLYYLLGKADFIEKNITGHFSSSPYVKDPYLLPPRVTASGFSEYNMELQAAIVGTCFSHRPRWTEACAASPYHPSP